MENFYEKMDNITACVDNEVADVRDIDFERVSADIKVDLPKSVLLSNWNVLNQGPTLLCVAFGTTEWVNEARNALWFKWDKNPNTLAWYIRTNLDSKIDERWTYIKYGPKWARKLGWVESYSQTNTIEAMMKSLYFGMPIQSGTNKVSWSATSKNNYIVTLWKWGWHHINIVWYNTLEEAKVVWSDGREYKDYFIIENTWGDKRGDNGYYYLPFDYALGVLYPTKKALLIESTANRKYAEKLIENSRKILEEKKITPVLKKYEYFNWEELALQDQENKNLFIVLQNTLKETGYKPIFRTIIWSNEDRTNARLLLEISNARMFERLNMRKK